MFKIAQKTTNSYIATIQKKLATKQIFKSSQERTRNFFEVNPIYPDFQDQDGPLFRDNTKQKFGSNGDKLERIKKVHMKHMYGKARNYVKKQIEKEQKHKNTQDSKQKNIKHASIHERVNSLAQSILVDQESKLQFGFGFDEFIQDLKEKKTKDQEGEYLQTLQQILHKLRIKNDTELVQLYKYVIAEETQDLYRNDARRIILKRVLSEIKEMKDQKRNDSQVLDKYLDYSKSSKEFVLNSFNDQSELLNEDIEKMVKSDELNNVAKNLALQKLEKKIEVNKEQEAESNVAKSQIFSSDFSDDGDFFGTMGEKKKIDAIMGNDSEKMNALNVNDWKTEQIYKEIKHNFKRNRDTYEEEQHESQQLEKNSQEFFSFLEKNKTDLEIDSYLSKYGIMEEIVQKPDFENILNNIDYLIDSAPLSLKSKLGNDSNEFKGSFVRSNISEEDMLWTNFGDNFIKIFPQGQLPDSQNQENLNQSEEVDIVNHQELQAIYEYDGKVDKQENIRNHVYSEKDLEENERVELEVYRRVKTDPFFTHYIQNDLRYFSERMVDGYSEATRQMSLYDKSGDILNYNESNLHSDKSIQQMDLDQPDIQFKQKQKIEGEMIEKVYAGGKRKQAHCMVGLTKGSGKVTVNKKKYLDYFPHPIHRNACMKAIYLANIPCQFDISITVRGGGISGQCQAISVAVARAVVKMIPSLRPQFLQLNMLKTDPRKRERKKTGQYRARKAWTYVRR